MDPVVLNMRPAAGAVGVDGLGTLKFSVRDVDTRVLGASVRALVAYYRVVYEGDQLPSRDPAVRRGEGRGFEGRFSDAAPVPPLGDPAAFTLVSGGLQIQKTAGTDQESFVLVADRLVPDVAVSIEATLEVLAWTAEVPGGSLGLSDLDNFTGAAVGLLNWRRKSGVFVLFMDDGATKTLTLAGPALSAAGDRTVLASGIEFDWAAGPVSLRLVWDDTPGSRSIIVTAANSAGASYAYVAPEGTNAVLESTPFVGGIRIAGMETSAPASNTVMAVVGTAGPTSGDAILIGRVAVSGFAAPMVLGGGPTPSAALVRAGNPVVPFRADALDWDVEGGDALSISESAGSVVLANGAGASALLSRAETDVQRWSWLLVARISVPVVEDLGGVAGTGPEVRIDDAGGVIILACVQGADGARYLGLRKSAATDMAGFLAGPEIDWGRPVTVTLMGTGALDLVRVEVDDAEYLSTTYEGALSDVSAAGGRVSLGWSAGGGVLRVAGASLFPNAVFAEPHLGLPTALSGQGWVLVGTAATLSESRYEFPLGTPGAQSFYYASPTDYEASAGGAWFVRGRVTGWVDAHGAPNGLGTEIGPVFLVQHSATKAAGVSFVETEGGRGFVFVAGRDSDVSEVVRQTARGRQISAPVALGQDTTYLFEVLPGKHVRLYLDYAPTPAIDIPWRDLVYRTAPAGIPSGAAGAFGSLDAAGAASLSLVFARFGYGRGYDFVLSPSLTEEELAEWVDDSEATLYVDLEDG